MTTKKQTREINAATNDLEDIYGPPISVYTEEQAVEDGMLFPVDEERFPGCRFSQGVYEAIMEKLDPDSRFPGSLEYRQRAIPLMMDVVMIAKQNRGDHIYTGDDLQGNVTGKKLWFAMNESGGITVMFPEDY